MGVPSSRHSAQRGREVTPLPHLDTVEPEPPGHDPQLRRELRDDPRHVGSRLGERAGTRSTPAARSALRSTRATSSPSSRNGNT
ncbi:hypothetical protein BJF90_38780 [Pseudonocardia sp. CNS-004]|nr:hypothetical protein BJF90_38780 [Pseudonocardia sp. CNS-004]